MSVTPKTKVALFIHGGGIRGLIPARIMAYIEAQTGLPVADMVDVFCGPSTGAILNAALTLPDPQNPLRPRYRARQMVRFYEREGIRIFRPDSFRQFRGFIHDFNNRVMRLEQLNALVKYGHYDPGNLVRPLQRLYGDHRLKDSLKSLIIPAYSIDGRRPDLNPGTTEIDADTVNSTLNTVDNGGHALWMKHIKDDLAPGKVQHMATDVGLFDAVMASASAPTYFPCHHFHMRYHGEDQERAYTCIDGSIFDNPAISYLGAIRPHLKPDENLVMIVLGTGYTNRSINREEWDKFGPIGVVDPANDLPLINMFFHASESALTESFHEEMGDNLYVFNKSMVDPNLHKSCCPSFEIDNASDENIRRIARFSDMLIDEQQNTLDHICHLLVSNRDRAEPVKTGKNSFFGFLKSKKQG